METPTNAISQSVSQQAQAAFVAGDHAEALSLLKQAIETDPNHPTWGLDLARMTFQTGRLAKANAILASLPKSQRTTHEAKTLSTLFQFSEIIADAPEMNNLKDTLQQNPNHLESLYQLAAYWMLHHQIEKAMDCLLQSIRFDKTDRGGRAQQLLLAIFTLLQDDHPQQINAYRRQLQGILF